MRGGPGGVSGTTIILHAGLHSVCQYLILSEVDEGVVVGGGESPSCLLLRLLTTCNLQAPRAKSVGWSVSMVDGS